MQSAAIFWALCALEAINTMLRQSITALLLSVTVAAGSAAADTLIVEGIGMQASNSPARGMTQQAVETRWGQPVSKKDPVGTPPISSWEYSTFVVYFENAHVIHSVAKR
jgi:hypothetical protein